jgi:hypothetical protein
MACPVCKKKDKWKWGERFVLAYNPVSTFNSPFGVITCSCGYTMFVQQTPENEEVLNISGKEPVKV